jgi:hypothetical protein
MQKFLGILFTVFMCFQGACFANSVNLFNDSVYTLKAIIYDANGRLLGEFILNARDAATWSDDQDNFGTEIENASQTPYSVNWQCMGGTAYGTCSDVAAGAVVTAQGCSGSQQCQQQKQQQPAQQYGY